MAHILFAVSYEQRSDLVKRRMRLSLVIDGVLSPPVVCEWLLL